MKVTRAETTSEVFHFPETLCVSQRKKTVEAIKAMEISQNEIPTKSSGRRLAANAVEGSAASTIRGARPFFTSLLNIITS